MKAESLDLILSVLAVANAVWTVGLAALATRRAREALRDADLRILISFPKIALEMALLRDLADAELGASKRPGAARRRGPTQSKARRATQ